MCVAPRLRRHDGCCHCFLATAPQPWHQGGQNRRTAIGSYRGHGLSRRKRRHRPRSDNVAASQLRRCRHDNTSWVRFGKTEYCSLRCTHRAVQMCVHTSTYIRRHASEIIHTNPSYSQYSGNRYLVLVGSTTVDYRL